MGMELGIVGPRTRPGTTEGMGAAEIESGRGHQYYDRQRGYHRKLREATHRLISWITVINSTHQPSIFTLEDW